MFTFFPLFRQCSSESVRYRREEGHMAMYCVDGCAAVTRCGETQVPPEHLDVGYSKNYDCFLAIAGCSVEIL